MVPDRLITGDDVADLRQALGLTQTEFGYLCSVTGVAVGKWERRGSAPALISQRSLALFIALQEYAFGADSPGAMHRGRVLQRAISNEGPLGAMFRVLRDTLRR